MAISQNYTAVVQVKVSDVQLKSQLNNIKINPLTLKVRVDTKDAQTQLNSTTNVTKDFQKQLDSTTAKVDKMSNSLKGAGQQAKSFGTDFLTTMAKVVKFYIITKIIQTFTQAIDEAVTSVKELDDSLIELQKVSDEAKTNLSGFTDQAFELAEAMSTSASAVTDAVTEFSKSGYSLQESFKLAESALVFQTIADDAISASDSATVLIQTMKAYNMTASDSEHIVDALNEVSNNYAVSSTDLSQSIGKVASSANLAGVDFEHLLGLMTASTEITQNASKVATGYKTILTNLMTKDLEAQFNEFGLTMRDTNGALKDGYTIIEELSTVYNSLGEVWDEDSESMVSLNDNMNALLEDIAGKYNINTLVAGMQNFSQAINATESALNSSGSAQEEFSTALTSMTKKLEGLKGQFQELVWGDGGLNSFLKFLIDLGTGILKFLNYTDALRVALTVVSVLLAVKLIPKFILFGNTLVTNIGQIALFTMETGSLSAGLKAVGISATTAQFALGSLVAVLSICALALNAYRKSQEEAQQAMQDMVDSAKSEIDSLDSLLIQIKNETLTREELYKLIEGTDAYSKEMEDLENVNDLRQVAIDKINEEKQARAQDIVDFGLGQYEEALKRIAGTSITSPTDVKYSVPDVTTGKVSTQTYISGISDKGTQTQIELLKKLKDQIVEQRSSVNKASAEWEQYSADITLIATRLSELDTQLDADTSTINDFNNALSILGVYYDSTTGTIQTLTEEQKKLQQATSQTADALTLSNRNTITSFDSLNEVLDELQSNYNSLTDVVEEYNSTGKLSFDSIQKLLSLDQEYLSMLKMENGQIVLNTEAIKEKMKVEIEASKESLRATLLANYAEASSQDIKDELLDTYRAQIKLLNALTDSLDATTESTSDLTDELKEQKSVLEDTISNYKDVFSYLKNVVNEEIDSLKSQRDSEVEAIENIQDASEELYDTEVKNIKALIKELEEKQQLEEDTYDSKIESLNTLSDYYDNEINKLRDVNDEISEQIKLQEYQEALAKAKATKVMVLGENGFEYRTDEEAVSKATSDLQSYQNELARNKEIDALQQKKDEVEAQIDYYKELSDTTNDYYDSEIDKLDTYLDDLKEKYEEETSNLDTQINNIKQSYQALIDEKNLYLDELDKGEKEYETIQSKNLAQILYGKDFENQTNEERLKNLTAFVANYNAKLSELGNISDAIDNGGIIENKSSAGLTDSNSVNVSGLTTGSKVLNMSEVALSGDYGDTSSIIGRPSSILGAVKQYDAFSTTSSNNSSSISIQNLNLDNVTDVGSFISELNSLSGIKSSMTQKAYG